MTLLIPSILAFVLTCLCIPGIIEIAHKKQLFDVPNHRSSHQLPTPSLGGVAMIIGIMMSTLLCANQLFSTQFQFVICSLLMVFMVGLKDDLMNISPSKKLIGQVVAAFVVVGTGLKITNLHGLLGITEIPIVVSYLVSIFLFVFISNAYNLIDGINGLSGSLITIATLAAGAWFYIANDYPFAIFSFAVAGATLGFLSYNMSSKIFMGDNGSLVAGFIISILMIRFLETYSAVDQVFIMPKGMLAIVASVVFIPVFDTIRVFCVRITNGKSPFAADRGHIHHILLDNGLTHIQATCVLSITQLGIIGFAYAAQAYGFIPVMMILFALAIMCTSLLQERATKRQATPIIRMPSAPSAKVIEVGKMQRA